jgi:hypothetical protein
MEVLLRALACLCLIVSLVTAQSEQDVCHTASRSDFISPERYDTSRIDFRNKLLPEMKKIMCTGGCQDKTTCRLSVAFDSKHQLTFLKEDHSGAASCDESDWVRYRIGAISHKVLISSHRTSSSTVCTWRTRKVVESTSTPDPTLTSPLRRYRRLRTNDTFKSTPLLLTSLMTLKSPIYLLYENSRTPQSHSPSTW